MKVIVKNKLTFDTTQFENVSNVAYDSTTKIYTITYGTSQTASFSAVSYLVAIMFS